MEEKLKIEEFLKGIFGFKKADHEPIKTDPSPQPPTLEVPVVLPTPKPRSEAYLNRKKGRPVHEDAFGYWKIIIDYLAGRGEATPGVMAQELKLPKSTLIYNLNKILTVCAGKGRYDEIPKINHLLAGKRVERVGAGKYVRYRIVDVPPGPQE